MKKSKINKYMILGLLINSLLPLANRYINFSDTALGLLSGTGWGLLLLGIIFTRKDAKEAKNAKKWQKKILKIEDISTYSNFKYIPPILDSTNLICKGIYL